jgi:hypothetical protein
MARYSGVDRKPLLSIGCRRSCAKSWEAYASFPAKVPKIGLVGLMTFRGKGVCEESSLLTFESLAVQQWLLHLSGARHWSATTVYHRRSFGSRLT